MKNRTVLFFTFLINAWGLPLLLEAVSSVKVTVRQNISGVPVLPQAEVCLTASDGSVRRQETGNNGVTTFQNVPPGNVSIRAQKSGFNGQVQSGTIADNVEQPFIFALNQGSNPLIQCNEQGPNAADIMVSLQQTSPSTGPAVMDSTVRYRLTIRNSGLAGASNVIARVNFPDGFGTPTGSGAGVTCNEINLPGAIGPIAFCEATLLPANGGSRVADFTLATPKTLSTDSQDFTINVVADPGNAIPEGNNENNNSASLTTTVQKRPDFTVELSNTPASSSSSFSYTLKVKNIGDKAATAVTHCVLPQQTTFVRFEDSTFNNCNSGGGHVYCNSATMQPDTEKSVRIVARADAPGGTPLNFSAKADPTNAVAEKDETNNERQLQTTVQGVNLEFAELDPELFSTPSFPLPGETIWILVNVKVRNSGSGNAPSSSVELRSVPSPFQDKTASCGAPRVFESDGCQTPNSGEGCGRNPCSINALNAGQTSIRKIFSISGHDNDTTKTSRASFTVCIDPQDLIDETNETDNCRTFLVDY
ncbi:hypothetical protein L0156_06760 [bacterium]|nr:hypothetical protein [bacterium]